MSDFVEFFIFDGRRGCIHRNDANFCSFDCKHHCIHPCKHGCTNGGSFTQIPNHMLRQWAGVDRKEWKVAQPPPFHGCWNLVEMSINSDEIAPDPIYRVDLHNPTEQSLLLQGLFLSTRQHFFGRFIELLRIYDEDFEQVMTFILDNSDKYEFQHLVETHNFSHSNAVLIGEVTNFLKSMMENSTDNVPLILDFVLKLLSFLHEKTGLDHVVL